MTNETPENRIWRLEQERTDILRRLERLTTFVDGNGQPGAREELREIRRTLQGISTLSITLQSLENTAVRNARFELLEKRVADLEKDRTKQEGWTVGRRGLIASVVAGLTVFGLLVTLLVNILSLRGMIGGG